MNDSSIANIWKVGSIVALKTHPYSSGLNNESIILTGDPQLQSPLMVIIEAFKEGKSHFDENTGLIISEKGNYQCRCMWYSSKTHQFEDSVLSSRLLQVIEPGECGELSEGDNRLKSYGGFVRFKTAKLELNKKKGFLKQTDFSNTKNYNTITSELSFVSPVMQVVGTIKNENKEPLVDLKTGERRRYISQILIKCKYYNSFSNKFSEALLPIEALEYVFPIKGEKLAFISRVIEENGYLKTSCSLKASLLTILKPEFLSFKSGNYYLQAFDFLLNKSIEILIDQHDHQFQLSSIIKNELPSFHEGNGKLTIKSIDNSTIAEILNTSNANSLFRIIYQDNYGKITERTIGVCSIVNASEKPKNKFEGYLKAYCFLRNAERYFKIDQIRKFETWDL